jgi:hypothetical protein
MLILLDPRASVVKNPAPQKLPFGKRRVTYKNQESADEMR